MRIAYEFVEMSQYLARNGMLKIDLVTKLKTGGGDRNSLKFMESHEVYAIEIEP